jgi:hypothetical protein
MAFPTGEGYDCSFGISGSFTGFANIIAKSAKHTYNAKKKVLMDGLGITRGYKYYDHSEEMTLEFFVQGSTGNTGTLQVTPPQIGTKVVIGASIQNHMTGSWSLDKVELAPTGDDVEGGSMTISRFVGTTIA